MKHEFRFGVHADYGEVRTFRCAVRERLETTGLAEAIVDRLVLVLDEIVCNSIEHGHAYRSVKDVLEVRVRLVDGHLDIRFCDPSCPPHVVREIDRLLVKSRQGVSPDSERGRGLFLIHDGLEDLEVRTGPGGVGLELRGRLRSGW